ncbi:MAG TPA: chalcone isomerase family protein [Rubrivivax sp.]
MPHRPTIDRRLALQWGACALAASFGVQAQSLPAEVRGEWPTASLQGSGRLRFFGLQVYDIRLWTPEPRFAEQDWARTPLALEIEYARSLVGRLIAERSIEEMRRSGPIAAEAERRWLAAMTGLFPDVKAGDRITGIQRPETATRFFHNGNLRGEVRDAEFTRRFFGIWLAPSTSEPRLREALLGTS